LFQKIFSDIFFSFNISILYQEFIILFIWIIFITFVYKFLILIYSHLFRLVILSLFPLILIFNTFFIINNIDFEYINLSKNFETYDENKLEFYKFNKKPNIHFIILDSYSSEELISHYYPLDNLFLFNYLKKNNFYVKKNAISHYNSTVKSIPAIFNSNYFNKELLIKNTSWQKIWKNSFEVNDVKKILLKNEYDIQSLFCKYNYYSEKKNCKSVDNLSFISEFNMTLSKALFFNTPLKYLFELKILNKEKIYYFEKYSDLSKLILNQKNNNPIFNYIHFAIPHAPYVFDRNCNFKELSNDQIVDNNKLLNIKNLKSGYYENYLCASQFTSKIITNILNKDKNSIIVLISDHGPHINIDQTPEQINYTDIMDWHSILLSIRIENNCRNNFEKNLSHVNLFRIIFNCLNDKKYSLLDFYIYYEENNHNNGAKRFLDDNQILNIKNKYFK